MSREMPERRDAMKELVELVAELCERIDHDAEDIGCDVRTVAEIIPLLGPAVDKARQSLSRTSDEGGETCPVCEKGTLTRIECCMCDTCKAEPVLPDQIRRNDARLLSRIGSKPVQRQDAMLERRGALSDAISLCENAPGQDAYVVGKERAIWGRWVDADVLLPMLRQALSRTSDRVPRQAAFEAWTALDDGDPRKAKHVLANALDRTSDEGTGKVLPEALVNDMREDAEVERGAGNEHAAKLLEGYADELDRAIAQYDQSDE